MAKRKITNSHHPKSKKDKRLEAIYAKSRADFSAADLQKFTEIEDEVPFDEILAQLEQLHRKPKGKRPL